MRVPNFGYHLSIAKGRWQKMAYRALMPWLALRSTDKCRQIGAAVYSFCCERDVPEQAASIRSFLRYAGIPFNFTVVSDGSITEDSSRLLRQIHDCVRLQLWSDFDPRPVPQAVIKFAHQNPMGKKLFVEISLPVSNPTIYADSDILFFAGAADILEVIAGDRNRPKYLLDCQPSLDRNMLYTETELESPVNAGFYILFERPNWQPALERFEQLEQPIPNSEQTVVHLTLHGAKATLLDPAKYILSLDDQTTFSDKYRKDVIALRHYVNPVRHKFWSFLF